MFIFPVTVVTPEIGAIHIEAQLECEADFERGFRLGAAIISDLRSE